MRALIINIFIDNLITKNLNETLQYIITTLRLDYKMFKNILWFSKILPKTFLRDSVYLQGKVFTV